jgi:hypothetical protein
MSKGRVPRPVRRTGTEIHEDARTQRKRQRGQEELEVIRTQLDWVYDDLESADDSSPEPEAEDVEENLSLADPIHNKGPVTSIEAREDEAWPTSAPRPTDAA